MIEQFRGATLANYYEFDLPILDLIITLIIDLIIYIYIYIYIYIIVISY